MSMYALQKSKIVSLLALILNSHLALEIQLIDWVKGSDRKNP